MKKHEVLAATSATADAAIASATEGLSLNCFHHLHNDVSKETALTICNYLFSLKSEVNPADHYRKDVIILLCKLHTFFNNSISFSKITREECLRSLIVIANPRTLTHCTNGLVHTIYTGFT